jgi:hypothetical protein
MANDDLMIIHSLVRRAQFRFSWHVDSMVSYMLNATHSRHVASPRAGSSS